MVFFKPHRDIVRSKWSHGHSGGRTSHTGTSHGTRTHARVVTGIHMGSHSRAHMGRHSGMGSRAYVGNHMVHLARVAGTHRRTKPGTHRVAGVHWVSHGMIHWRGRDRHLVWAHGSIVIGPSRRLFGARMEVIWLGSVRFRLAGARHWATRHWGGMGSSCRQLRDRLELSSRIGPGVACRGARMARGRGQGRARGQPWVWRLMKS